VQLDLKHFPFQGIQQEWETPNPCWI
jgi:hypothetical protein